MEIQPLTWNFNKDILLCNAISQDGPIQVMFKPKNTYLLKSGSKIDRTELDELAESFDADIKVSAVEEYSLIVRNPTNIIGNWISNQIDPAGLLTSFFQYSGIQPYANFLIPESIYEGKQKFINEHEVIISKSDYVYDNIRRLFWDLEVITPRKEFVYSEYIDNHIIAISIIFQYKSEIKKYFLYWGSYDIQNNFFESIRYSGERDVILKFYQLIDEFRPDRMYTYNGDGFDIPYIITRTQLHEIQQDIFKFNKKRIKGKFQWETVKVFDNPNIDQVDLLRVAQLLFPGLPNYKLETFAQLYLGEGKTGLAIKEMFNTFYSQDERMELLADYSVKDSVLLMRLTQILKLDERINDLCNTCGVIFNQLLNEYPDDLVNKSVYMVDPGALNLMGKEKSSYISNIDTKLYRDVYIYDYSMYFSIEMSTHEDEFTYKLSQASLKLPSHLKSKLYNSKYYDYEPIYIDSLLSQDNILEITPFSIKSLGPLTEPLPDALLLINRYEYFLALGKVSYAAFDGVKLIKVGTSGVLKPKFELGKQYLDQMLSYLFDISEFPDLPRLETINIEELIIKEKVKNIDEYPRDSLKHRLAYQYGQDIKTWAELEYLETIEGPILIELYNNQPINFDKYKKELKKITELKKYKK